MKIYMDAAKEAYPSKVVVAVPPFFEASDFGGPPGHPTPHEAKFDAYTAVIGEAKGVDWFSYYRGSHLTELWEGLQEIAGELNGLGPVILSPSVSQTISVIVNWQDHGNQRGVAMRYVIPRMS